MHYCSKNIFQNIYNNSIMQSMENDLMDTKDDMPLFKAPRKSIRMLVNPMGGLPCSGKFLLEMRRQNPITTYDKRPLFCEFFGCGITVALMLWNMIYSLFLLIVTVILVSWVTIPSKGMEVPVDRKLLLYCIRYCCNDCVNAARNEFHLCKMVMEVLKRHMVSSLKSLA